MTVRSLQLTVIGVVLLALMAGYFGWRTEERRLGAQAVLLHAADSAHHVDSIAQARSAAALAGANHRLDSLAHVAVTQAVVYQKAKVVDDTVHAHLASARDSLAAVLADSQATIAALRAGAARMIQASDSTVAAQRIERQTADSALHAATRAYTFAIDSVRHVSTAAVDAAVKRAIDAEQQAKIARGLIPSSFVGWVKVVVVGAGMFEVGRATAGAKLP